MAELVGVVGIVAQGTPSPCPVVCGPRSHLQKMPTQPVFVKNKDPNAKADKFEEVHSIGTDVAKYVLVPGMHRQK